MYRAIQYGADVINASLGSTYMGRMPGWVLSGLVQKWARRR
ncbi:MAG: hypothetical protein O2800_06220 [Planctomycetota bacterium]|nr:hypothetical protein [Planctomycetota bacterium]